MTYVELLELGWCKVGYSAYETFAFQTLHLGYLVILFSTLYRADSTVSCSLCKLTYWAVWGDCALVQPTKLLSVNSGPGSTVPCTFQLKHLIWHISKTFLKTLIFKTPPSSGRQQTGHVTTCVIGSHQSVRNTQQTRNHVVKGVRRHAWAAGASQPSVTRIIACEISSFRLRVACEANQTTKGA